VTALSLSLGLQLLLLMRSLESASFSWITSAAGLCSTVDDDVSPQQQPYLLTTTHTHILIFTRSPRPPSWILKGPTAKGREGKERKGKERGGREREKEGRGRVRREGCFMAVGGWTPLPILFNYLLA